MKGIIIGVLLFLIVEACFFMMGFDNSVGPLGFKILIGIIHASILPGFALIIYLGDKAQERNTQKAIDEGRLRVISHAEYNRSFGIENKLSTVKENKNG